MLAEDIIEYMRAKDWRVSTGKNEVNIVYLEGSDKDGFPIRDTFDQWNDRRIVITFDEGTGKPIELLNVEATSEPGRASTFTSWARRLGGVARIPIGQHMEKWKVGFHKTEDHPALVQRAELYVYRDANKDGARIRRGVWDPYKRATGINQHSTRPGLLPSVVGYWSAGCLVGRSWREHLAFMWIVENDPRFLADRDFLFDTTVIDTTDFHSWRKKEDRI
jgi:hypothetical protein